MNARNPSHVVLKRGWRTEFDTVDPTARRLALYTLQFLNVRHKTAERRLNESDELANIWELVAPLLHDAEIAALGGEVSRQEHEFAEIDDGLDFNDDDGDDDDLSPNSRRMRQQRKALLLAPPAGLLDRLAQADGHAPTSPTIAALARLFGLSEAEVCVLDFVEKRHLNLRFCKLLRLTGRADANANLRLLASMVGLPVDAVQATMAPKSVLRACQLIKCPERAFYDMEDFLVGGHALGNILLTAPRSEQELTDLLIEAAPVATRAVGDFPHLNGAVQDVCTALAAATKNAVPGVNALFYGPPGVGKTELALAVAATLGVQPFRIRAADDDGDGLDREGRLGAYLLAQRLLAHRSDALIIFDEIEDVFSSHGSLLVQLLGGSAAGQQKGWMNRILEENTVPAIWITNDVEAMDPAFLRRFLLPIEFVPPPQSVRRKMVEQHLGASALPESLLATMAADAKLTPAQFSAARQVLALHDVAHDPAAGEAVVRRSVAAMRRLLHGSGLPTQRHSATVFDIAFLNVSGGIAPARIADALARRGRGTLCFYGAPGTGKTEFTHVLADALERELIVRRVSDLVSKYVGETEANIATLFRSIDADRSVLFIDEVDSFLRSRRRAERGWEATQVNELLQQMENYPGIFIAATNLVEDLDAAALRRFDFKLQFLPLDRAQRVAMFAREALGAMDRTEEIPGAIRNRLGALDVLTAGDFANVCRQRDLLDESLSPEEFLRRLVQECRWKMAASS